MKAYKLVRIRKRDNTCGPLFINTRLVLQFGEWHQAENHPTKGFAVRPGWHCSYFPFAPHLSTKDRVWIEVEVEDFRDFPRPPQQGGMWILANKMKPVRRLSFVEVERINREQMYSDCGAAEK